MQFKIIVNGGKYKIVNANREVDVMRMIVTPELTEFVKHMYDEQVKPTFRMKNINRQHWNSNDDDDHGGHVLMTKPGIEYLNISVQRLENLMATCTSKDDFNEKLSAVLSDDAIINIFYYMTTPFQGWQSDAHTSNYCIITKI